MGYIKLVSNHIVTIGNRKLIFIDVIFKRKYYNMGQGNVYISMKYF